MARASPQSSEFAHFERVAMPHNWLLRRHCKRAERPPKTPRLQRDP